MKRWNEVFKTKPKPPPERPPGISRGVRGRLEPGALRRPRDGADWLRKAWRSR